MHRWLAAFVFAACLSTGQSAFALGLGEITTRSALNEPMQAEISLLGATRDELTTLEIRLASADTFDRYGIDKPGYLSNLRFRVRGGANPTVEITSSQPITEPFVTMLVEAVWPRGRLLREYTVLLDPPTYAAPAASSAAPAVRRSAAPTNNRASANTATIRRSAAAPVSAPIDGDQYRVQRNDTLWEIAQRIQPNDSVSINQVMLAIYEANPAAFDGNINRLNAGAVLNLPTEQALFAINRTAAQQEVQRQIRDWRGGAGSLTLVAPDEDTMTGSVSSTDTRGSATAAGGTANNAELTRLQRELAEKERLLAVRSEELARLQAQLSANDDAAAAAEPEPEPVATDELYADEPVAEDATDAPLTSDEIFAEDADTTTDGAAIEEPATDVVEEAPVAETPATRTPAVVTTTRSEPSLFEKIKDSIWTYVGGGVVLIAIVLGLLARRRSQDNEAPTGTWESLDAADLEDLDGTLAATGRLRDIGSTRVDDAPATAPSQSIEDTDTMERTAPVDDIASTTAASDETVEDTGYSIEDTFSSDTAINLDQSDPLAEADFHMAYGLYDQAADLVKGAMAVDPSDARLKAKLCEIYFVWGNQDGFVEAASDLKSAVGADSNEWNKVVIMGQQIAPAHALFSGAVASTEAGDLDMSFDATMEAGVLDSDIDSGDDGFGEVFDRAGDGGDSDGGTVEQLADISGIDFEFDESAMLGDDATAELDANAETGSRSGIDFEFDGSALEDGTVEQPVDLGGNGGSAGATEEIDIADLDLDTGDLDKAMSGTTGDISDDLLEATGVTSVLPDDFRVSLPEDTSADDETVLAPTGSMDLDDIEMTSTQEMPDIDETGANDATGIVPGGGMSDVDLDVADLTSELRTDDLGADEDGTVQQPQIDGSSTLFSEQVFGGDEAVDTAADTGLNLAIDDESGDTSIAEVGTKLDLARAYVDMGDPDGARSILEEVMVEGDEGQREEAQKLLETLG